MATNYTSALITEGAAAIWYCKVKEDRQWCFEATDAFAISSDINCFACKSLQ